MNKTKYFMKSNSLKNFEKMDWLIISYYNTMILQKKREEMKTPKAK